MTTTHKTAPSLSFKQLTPESIRLIKELASIEKYRLEIEQADELASAETNKKRRKQRRERKPKLKPNKDLETGQRLPEKCREQMPKSLFGVPIEEIDPFYRNEHVNKIRI